MKRLLVGWELGSGRGHIEILRPIIFAALDAGLEVIVVVRDLPAAMHLFAGAEAGSPCARLSVVQAPIFKHISPPRLLPPISLSDILAHIGFGDREMLRPVLGEWQKLIYSTDPDVVLADVSPSLVAAVRTKIPVITIGNGWTIPPDGEPMPRFARQAGNFAQEERAEERILAAFSACGFYLDRASSLLRGDTTFIFTPTYLDPYRLSRRERVWWPPNVAGAKSGAAPTQRNSVVVYLPPKHPALGLLISALASVPGKVDAYFGGLIPVVPANVCVSPLPLDLKITLSCSRFAVNHGGLGIASWCSAFEIPQLVIPADIEKQAIAAAVEEHGIGMSADSGAAILGKLMRVEDVQWPGRPLDTPSPDQSVEEVMKAITSLS